MKGIILSGGSGTRLYPATSVVVKQLLPVYDKPMVYYPLSVLMMAGLREILIISTPRDTDRFRELFGDGSALGLKLSYAIQSESRGIADAFLLGEDFLDGDAAALALGDNFLYGDGIRTMFQSSCRLVLNENRAVVFGYKVREPQNYGVAEFDSQGRVISIEEKPAQPKSKYAVIGFYLYPSDVVQKAKALSPSARGEIEITDLNQSYLLENRLSVELLGRGFAWLDTGTHGDLLEAGSFVQAIEKRQGQKIACPEEIAYRSGWIGTGDMLTAIERYKNSSYGQYLKEILDE
ncbi:MAG: glucose-1-phosphate thymidylyltransferase RfbA [Deltaproteobacteria bacterium]|nr:glucose-1-phosphate thymidylyltransferase RfbA [Deltaproteobacteria bacterium]